MMFQRKLDRAMNWLKEKNSKKTNDTEVNKENIDDLEYYDPREEWLAEQENDIQIEKEDIPAIIISAFIVFGPIIIILIIIALLVFNW